MTFALALLQLAALKGEHAHALVEVGPLFHALRAEQAVLRVHGGAPLVGDQRPGGFHQIAEGRVALRLADEGLARGIDVLAAALEQFVLVSYTHL